MPSRSRSYDARLSVTGSLDYHWPSVRHYENIASNGPYGTCDDTYNEWQSDNPFDLRKRETWSPILNGKLYSYGRLTRSFENYPIDQNVVPSDPFVPFPEQNLIQVAQEAVNRTNPSVAHVSIPTAIGELKDLPDLVRDMGFGLLISSSRSKRMRRELLGRRNKPARLRGNQKSAQQLIQQVARLESIPESIYGLAMGNLAWRFGMAPMISDVRKLLQFQAALKKRVDFLMRLSNGKEISRRVGVHEDCFDAAPIHRTVQSRGAVITADEKCFYYEKYWAVVRWALDFGVDVPTFRKDVWKHASNAVLGITTFEALNTAWELLPWSWLSDWFAGYDNIISNLNNTIPAHPTAINLMRTAYSIKRWHIKSIPSWVSLTGPFEARETRKWRTQLPLASLYFPTVGMPMLTRGQWSILGSLAALSIRGQGR